MDIYDAIFKRRDIRQFRSDAIDDARLVRILNAAHHAGSVGFMQPWNFTIVRADETKQRVMEIFRKENAKALENYHGERRDLYASLKLQGILDAPINLAVSCDRSRGGEVVLGRNSIRDTDLYSTCCAIQNLWLAARAEEVGVGWVSIIDVDAVKTILGIPDEVVLVAYLCIGYPIEFKDKPLLEEVGWEKRGRLEDLVFDETWNKKSRLFTSG